MSDDEVLKVAKYLGAAEWMLPTVVPTKGVSMTLEQLGRLAELITAAERERCAKVCEQSDDDGEGPDCWGWHSKDYAKAIRSTR